MNDAGLFEVKHTTPAKLPGLHLGCIILSGLAQSGCALYGYDRWIVIALMCTAGADLDLCALVWMGTSAQCPLLSYPTESKNSHLVQHAQPHTEKKNDFIVMNPIATLLRKAFGIIPYILVRSQAPLDYSIV